MATKKIDPQKTYKVKMARVARWNGVVLRPRDDVRLKGRALEAVIEAVESYSEA